MDSVMLEFPVNIHASISVGFLQEVKTNHHVLHQPYLL